MRCIFSITRHQPRHPFSTLCCIFSITRDQPRHPPVIPCVAASQRQQRRSANSVAAWIPRRSVAASQRQQRRSGRSRVAASQRRSANSVAASIPRRSVAAPTASQRRSRVAASQRHPLPRASQCRSVAASQRHPPPGASQRNVGNPRFGPLCPSTVKCRFWKLADLISPAQPLVHVVHVGSLSMWRDVDFHVVQPRSVCWIGVAAARCWIWFLFFSSF